MGLWNDDTDSIRNKHLCTLFIFSAKAMLCSVSYFLIVIHGDPYNKPYNTMVNFRLA